MSALFDDALLEDLRSDEDLATDRCSLCDEDVFELDGIWYHALGTDRDHLARPGATE